MKLTIAKLILIIYGFTGFPVLAQQTGEDTEIFEEWRLSKDKDDIRIYTRWIDAEEGRKARQMHAVMRIEASVSSGVIAIIDPGQVTQWLNRVEEYYHYDHSDNFNWYAYTQFKVPWPLKNQDLVTKNILSHDQATGKVRVSLEGAEKKMPEKGGVQRIPGFEGSWEFTPLENGLIQIDYYIFTRSKPVLPRWLTDPVIEYGLWNSLTGLREIIMENEKKNASLPFSLR